MIYVFSFISCCIMNMAKSDKNVLLQNDENFATAHFAIKNGYRQKPISVYFFQRHKY